ncbi:unnamed protein product [Zymoseptoria tritici ST99CH_1A5]|uniref:2EXR domain-containing protein n=1 Tax=Zymoseptoria tritici ST99CH_1A5 TaxID=1276529 RepID=A0A1Y6LSR6_ZYMTR|nr:unnamed protein product [Zymoseptoria tritici ST99CH_3D1]SMY27444.1 unnamed protein product [Zymoseptoria tritici ST99CH_1A5]
MASSPPSTNTNNIHQLVNSPPLLRIPPELRNHIYSYIFPTPPAQTFTEYEPDSEYHKTTKDISHPLLQVNRQLRHEAYKMFFANAIFRLTAKTALVSFLKALPQEFVSTITNIQLAMPYLDRNYHRSKTCILFVNGSRKKREFLELNNLFHTNGINGLRDEAVKMWLLLYPGTNSLEGVWTGDEHMFIG